MQSHRKGQTDTNNDLQSTTQTLKIEQHESHKNGMNPCPPKGLAVRSLYLIPKLHT